MPQFDFYVGIDPGTSGGFSIIDSGDFAQVHRNPVKKILVNKKNKNIYDIEEFKTILSQIKGRVLFIQELVGVRPGEGGVAAFGFGRSSGLTIGLASGLNFRVVEVSPAKWKKDYPELETGIIAKKRSEIKEIKLKNKTIKDSSKKKSNNRLIEKLNREIKNEAKTAARMLASNLYPQIADCFKNKNSDGVAESLLIALYGRNHKDELV